jgi:probable F420-dependent oxidoreductase
VKVDSGLGFDPLVLGEAARHAEELGYDGLWSVEASHDPFLPLAQASATTERIELGTGIAVAFARNPMNLAMLANDLQTMSRGRFILGLGSQVRAHVTKRYSMPWSHPAARMRELILAIRAIWDSWADPDQALRFRGEFYTHILMTPFFDPGPNPFGNPPILLAAVGPAMTEVAGEVADGLLAHTFTTQRYLQDVTLPALERGAAKAGKLRQELQISYAGFVVTGRDDDEIGRATAAIKSQIAFYASTPAYRPVLRLHGWEDVQPELNALARRGHWNEMAALIDDSMLDVFAVVAPLDEVPRRVRERFGGIVDRFTFYAPYEVAADEWRTLLAGFR